MNLKSLCDLGHKICKFLEKNLGLALEVIRFHHEKLAPSGYPDGLPEALISMAARMMAVVDIYAALASDRPSRRVLSKEHPLKSFRRTILMEN